MSDWDDVFIILSSFCWFYTPDAGVACKYQKLDSADSCSLRKLQCIGAAIPRNYDHLTTLRKTKFIQVVDVGKLQLLWLHKPFVNTGAHQFLTRIADMLVSQNYVIEMICSFVGFQPRVIWTGITY